MRRVLALLAALLVLLAVGAGSVYAFDHGREDRIAEGVTVNGVDVGGLPASQAAAKLREALLQPLQRPVVVRHDGHRYTLTSKSADVTLDIDGSVDRAVEASREGNLLSRTWRALRGGKLHRDVTAKVTYAHHAVRRLVDRVQEAVDKPAQDATLDLSSGQIDPQPSHEGVAVRAKALRRDVRRTLLDTDADRRAVHVRTRSVDPEVTTDELAEQYPAVLILHRSQFKLSLYKNLKLAKTYDVAVGMVGLETPAGLYHIQNKAVNPAWTMPDSDWVAPEDRGKVVPGGSPENPLKARWMGIFDGAGIHGIDPSEYGTIGHAASHGCVRMRIPDVEELYPQVPVGAPIYIE